jgi:glycopeptide antibiotics resistance protein
MHMPAKGPPFHHDSCKKKRTMLEMSLRTKTRDLSCLILWIVLILLAGIFPLNKLVGHAHGEYSKWVPTVEDIRSPKYLLDIFFDMIGNTALFFPLGYFLSRLLISSSPLQRWLLAAGIGGTLSLGIEFYQVYCHNRFPSVFDVITNVIGTLMGVYFSLSRKIALPARPNPNVTSNPQNRSHTL